MIMPFIDSSGPPVLPNGHGSPHFSSGLGNSFESSTPVEYRLPSDLPIALLEIVDLERLRAGDVRESKKLFDACLNSGFFYLDLRHVKEGDVAGTIEGMLALNEELYDLDDEEKMAYDIDKLSPLKLNGWASCKLLRIAELMVFKI
jgi:non-haem dioxygenase in morphine synthesis N-terminal